MERKLATIRKVSEIKQHTNADALELAIIDGWQVVVKKGDFTRGTLVVYFEIDSWIPTELAPFLSKGKEPREFEGVKGERLRSIKLRGELSQGLVLPLYIALIAVGNPFRAFNVDEDVTEALNIKKWERPISAQLQGQAKGYFPSFLRKTDQERIQNVFNKLTPEQIEDKYEVTLKVDGSSMTAYYYNGEVGVCSRNLELKINEDNAGNSFVKKFIELGLEDNLKSFGRNIAIQGELYGVGINGNWENLSDIRFMVFDVFDIDTQSYFSPVARRVVTSVMGLDHVPVLSHTTLKDLTSISDYLNMADIKSINNPVAEGVVLKSMSNPDFSFKVINNKFLLSGGE